MLSDDGIEDLHHEMGPVYSLDADGAAEGPTCAQKGEFCFLCKFSATEDKDDPWSDIVDVITTLAEENKELSTIVRIVHRSYEQNVRGILSYTDTCSGETIENPEWSKDAIRRHIIFTSSQWPALFNNVCENIFVSLIALQNEQVKDVQTNTVDEAARKSLIHSMMEYSRFQHMRATTLRASKK